MRPLPLLLLLCASACVTVPTAPDSVVVQLAVKAPASDLYVGEGFTLAVVAIDPNGDTVTNAPITWSVDQPTIAAVSPAGTLSGLAPGQVMVTAKSGPVAAHRSILVHSSEPVKLRISAPTTGLPVGGSGDMDAEVLAEVGHRIPNPAITWTVSPAGVLTVDAHGRVTALAEGTASVTATAGRLSKSIQFQVPVPYPVSLTLSTPKAEVPVGEEMTLAPHMVSNRGQPMTGPTIEWQSNHPEIATVTSAGLVTGVSAGQVTITAKVRSLSAAVTLMVSAPVQLSLFPRPLVMVSGDHASVSAILVMSTRSSSAVTPVWSSSRPSVATISATGAVVAVAEGTTDITASYGAFTATMTITVLPLGQDPSGAGHRDGTDHLAGLSFVRHMGDVDQIEVVTETGAPAPGVVPAALWAEGTPRQLSLSPDGFTLVYDCNSGPGRVCWFRRDDASSGQFPMSNVWSATWMSDGIHLAMLSSYTGIVVYDIRTGASTTRLGPFYVNRPYPSADGSVTMYQCDYYKQYDDPLQLCQMDLAGNVTLYKNSAVGFSWAPDGRLAYISPGDYAGHNWPLVIEPFLSPALPDAPDVPGAQQFPGFDDATETAWSPDGTRLAVVRHGDLWLYDLPGLTNPRRIAYQPGTTISSITWR